MPTASKEICELSIIIISYNTREMTLACLASIYEQTAGHFEVVVVDNASTDGSIEAIRSNFPQVRLLAETVNHGFAAAHNIALPYCRADWLLLLNPDTVVLNGALNRLQAFRCEHPEAGIWGGRTLYADGRLNPYSCWHRQTLWSLFCRAVGLTAIFPKSEFFNREPYGHWQRDYVRDVDIVTGCLFLIARETWDRLDGFDPIFVMYGEEADLCLRAKKIGMRPAITPDATIIHYGGASEKIRSDKMVRLLRAKAELIKKHFPANERGLGLFLLKLWPLSRYLVLSLGFTIFRTDRFHNSAMGWRDIWRRRTEWCEGF